MSKYQIKALLNTKSVRELRRLAKHVSLSVAGYLKDELIEELATSLLSMEYLDECVLNESLINAMCFTADVSILNEINNIDMQECAITELEDNSFNTNLNKEGEINMNNKILIDVNNMDIMVTMVFAEIRSIQKDFDFNTQPIVILTKACENLNAVDRVTDVAYTITYGYPKDLTDKKAYVEICEATIYDEYDKQQNARRELAINNSMMAKVPSDKQRDALNKVVITLDETGTRLQAEQDAKKIQNVSNSIECIVDTIAKLKLLKTNFSATSLDFKFGIESGYEALANTPPTEGQTKFIDSIVNSGISYGENVPDTYGKARAFITASMPEFNRKSLVKEVQNQGASKVTTTTIEGFDDNKVRDTLYKVKKLNNIVGMVFPFYQENIWTLITKLDAMKPTELLAVQRACMTKNEEMIIEELSR